MRINKDHESSDTILTIDISFEGIGFQLSVLLAIKSQRLGKYYYSLYEIIEVLIMTFII